MKRLNLKYCLVALFALALAGCKGGKTAGGMELNDRQANENENFGNCRTDREFDSAEIGFEQQPGLSILGRRWCDTSL